MDNFDPYSVFLAIATNIPVLLMTGFVLQGHKCSFVALYCGASVRAASQSTSLFHFNTSYSVK